MSLPKRLSGIKYTSVSEFNSIVSIVNPNAGTEADGTPLPETVVASNVHAKVQMWRGKEQDKTQTRDAMASYKIIIRYPKTYSLDAGMVIVQGTRRYNIEAFNDPDGQKVELHCWVWTENDTVVS